MEPILTMLLPPGYEIEGIGTEGPAIVMRAATQGRAGTCPSCGQRSSRIHGYYSRTVHDLPIAAYAFRIHLKVRRYQCLNQGCGRQTFSSEMTDLVAPYQRKSLRLITSLYHIAQALGGQAGTRLARVLSMPASRDTLLRIIRKTFLLEQHWPRFIGIDDWAKRKGHTYGTIIVDLERHKVVELLPSRSVADVSKWLKTQPQVTVVSRDRSAEYRTAITESLPDAQQVVDRWHLVKNLRDVLERSLSEILPKLRAARPVEQMLPQDRPLRTRFPRAHTDYGRQEVVRERRIRQYQLVQELKADGVSIGRITKILGLDRTTVRKFYDAEAYPETNYRKLKPSILDPYLPYLEQRVQDGCLNAKQLWREIVEQGYPGTDSQVTKWMHWRRRHANDGMSLQPHRTVLAGTATRTSRRELLRLLMADPSGLNADDTVALRLAIQEPLLGTLHDVIRRFRDMVRQQDASDFDDWVATCHAAGLTELRRFANGLEKERSAILAAITTDWSNGQTEGQINRLKMLKRQMYGRANLDLLRARLLYSVDTT
jgi:transposase